MQVYLDMRITKYLILFSLLFLISGICFSQQVADTDFQYPILNPTYPIGKGSIIALDQAHNNFHTIDGRYAPFANFLKTDGYILKPNTKKIKAGSLSSIDILVIANAMDNKKWELPTSLVFTAEEVTELENWVRNGGSLFLIADHMPFPGHVDNIAKAFGFEFLNGFALRTDKANEIFSRNQQTLLPNIIINGKTPAEQIDSIACFTGQAFLAPSNATCITKLTDDYRIFFPNIAWQINDSTPYKSGKGYTNAAYMEYGKGRIVIFGEAAMFSAQLAGTNKQPMGMNSPQAKQNPQLLLNIIHWLDRKL